MMYTHATTLPTTLLPRRQRRDAKPSAQLFVRHERASDAERLKIEQAIERAIEMASARTEKPQQSSVDSHEARVMLADFFEIDLRQMFRVGKQPVETTYTTADVAAAVERFRKTGVNRVTHFSLGEWYAVWAKSTGRRAAVTKEICDSLVVACEDWLNEWDAKPARDTMRKFAAFLSLFVIPVLTRQKSNTSQLIKLFSRFVESLPHLTEEEWDIDLGIRLVPMSIGYHLHGTLVTGKRRLIKSLETYFKYKPDDLWCEKIFAAMALMAVNFTGFRMNSLLADSIKIAHDYSNEGLRLAEVAFVMQNYLSNLQE